MTSLLVATRCPVSASAGAHPHASSSRFGQCQAAGREEGVDRVSDRGGWKARSGPQRHVKPPDRTDPAIPRGLEVPDRGFHDSVLERATAAYSSWDSAL